MRRRVEVRCLLLSTIAAFTLHASGIAGLAQTTDPVGYATDRFPAFQPEEEDR